jgi:hypothetical protein
MFEEMGDAAGFARFVHRTDAEGDVGGKGRCVGALDQKQLEAIGEGVFTHLFGQGIGPGQGRQRQQKKGEKGRRTPQQTMFRQHGTPCLG